MNDKKPLLIKKVTVQRLEVSDEVSLRARRAKQSQNVIASSLSLLAMTQLLPRTELLLKKLLFTALFFCLTCLNARAEIIFEDNFDKDVDWKMIQHNYSYSNLWPNYTQGANNFPSNNPSSGSRYIGWYTSQTYLGDKTELSKGNDTLIIDSTNSRGQGKGVTYWCEVPNFDQPFEASDGLMYITLTDNPGDYGYNEIWIQLWRKFQSNFYTDVNGHKFIHASHYQGNGFNLNNWFPHGDYDLSHAPAIVGGMTGYGYLDQAGNKLRINYMMMKLRPYANYSDYNPGDNLTCGSLSHIANKTSYTYALLNNSGTKEGGWQNTNNFGDGDWHYHEYHLKMNSAHGIADGIYEYYIDGICQAGYHDVSWVNSGEMIGWNMVALGGNEDFQDTVEGGYEVYYAWDDLVISTNRVGQDYVIGSLRIDISTLPSGIINQGYSTTLIALAGTQPYTWSITSGVLPDGLFLNTNTGEISGTPVIQGTFAFTIQVTDADLSIATKELSITVEQSQISGDINSDGKVDITDIQACVNHVLGVQDWGIKADVNSDGSVNVQDVQMIVNTILGG